MVLGGGPSTDIMRIVCDGCACGVFDMSILHIFLFLVYLTLFDISHFLWYISLFLVYLTFFVYFTLLNIPHFPLYWFKNFE